MGGGESANSQDEDAFFLNVWEPEHRERLPALFFVVGGARTTGGGSLPWYDGRALAFVGQSAGAWYGHLLGVTPEARGLFRRLAHLSMGTRQPCSPEHSARVWQLTQEGLGSTSADSLLRAGMAALRGLARPRELGELPAAYLPTVAENVPAQLMDAVWAAEQSHVDAVFLRYTADEATAFLSGEKPESEATSELVDEWLATVPPEDVPPDWAIPSTPYEKVAGVASWRQFQRFPAELADALRAGGSRPSCPRSRPAAPCRACSAVTA
ncbi:hypothetical protein ACWEOE_31330 [Amycolatopsis sp. NPDC004368]